MKSILLVVTPPDQKDPQAYMKWNAINQTLSKTVEKTKGAELIAEGCVLIPSQDGLAVLGAAINVAEDRGLSYRVFFIDEATEWKRDFKKA